jgi:prohibitin 1
VRLVIAVGLVLTAMFLSRLAPQMGRFALARGLLAVTGLALGLSAFLVVVPAGHIGVVDLFGHVAPETLKSGIRFVNPLARVVTMTVRTQELKETLEAPSKEGLMVRLDVSVLYRLDPERASEIYRSVGQNYVNVLLIPQFRSVSRSVTASHDARTLYSSQREQLSDVISSTLRQRVGPRGIAVESTPLRRLDLPQGLAASIEEKLRAEQESQRMEFVIARERQEADRRRIEAQGVADYQRIVSSGVSDTLLRWKGIEATMKLAESANAKVVVIGAGRDGLPLILGPNKD